MWTGLYLYVDFWDSPDTLQKIAQKKKNYIYLKQDTFVCGSETCLWNLFLFMDLF